MPNRQDLEQILKHEVELALEAYELARQEFKGVMADIPSGLPHPDGTARIRNTGVSYNFAVHAYSEALKEFNNFISDGIVPDRFRDGATTRRR